MFDNVNYVCKLAPGGSGAYTMCFHGFGHGVLAYAEYEVPDAVELCQRVGTQEFGNEEANQCVGGAIMEMRGGIHDPELWALKKDKYLDNSNPLKMCQSDYMPESAKGFCYTYITPFIFDSAQIVSDGSAEDLYKNSFAFCDQISEDEYRNICYGGHGKEFLVLVQNRDIRNVDEVTNKQLQKAIDWCLLASSAEGETACLLEIQNSLYWGGENDFRTSIRYCSLIESETIKSSCFDRFYENVLMYRNINEENNQICDAVPVQYAKSCSAVLLR